MQKETTSRFSKEKKNFLEGTTLFEELLVSDVMKEPLSVKGDDSLELIIELLDENSFRHLPVVDSAGNIQGIISDRDVRSVVLRIRPLTDAEQIRTFWTRKKANSFMTKDPETVSPDTLLKDAGAILLENKISCLPVVEGTRLVGIITEADFVKLISE